jgi:hypothetical protein
LTPYSGKFAGYKVEKGKLSLDLKYKLSKNILIGENEIFLNQLTIGEEVDSPGATSFPVRLVVALLKDSKGNIDIHLPIRGDLDDPKFSFGHLILKAFLNLITKLVTSPFSALGGIIGGGGEELSFVDFESGRTVLAQDQKAKLDKLAEALNQRPALGLEIKGASDKQNDRKVLAEAELLRRLKGFKMDEMRAAGKPVPSDIGKFILIDEDYNRLLIQAYEFTFGEHPKGRFGAESKMLIAKTKERLIKEISVDETKLHQLAMVRSKQIRNYLIEKGKISDERLFIVDVEIFETASGGMIRTNLKLSGI